MKIKHHSIIKYLLVTVIVFTLISCTKKSVFKEYHTFSNLFWNMEDMVEFNFNIEQEQASKIVVHFRLIYDYPYPNIKYQVHFNDSFGNKVQKNIVKNVRLADGKYDGDILGDFIDIKDVYISDTVLYKGQYHVSIKQIQTKESLPYVGEVGIQVFSLTKE